MKWTQEQAAAITKRSPLLISAAAGSGKTAVLVERILQKILNEHHPVDITQLLVITFTKAAAAEMRERIRRRLDHELFKASERSIIERLLHQIAFIPQSNITTLHSFCLELLRKYYYLINYDPNFRVADEIEAALLRQDCINSVFENKYREEEPGFVSLVEAFGSDRDDQPLMDHVLNLYDFASSQVSPKDWLDSLSRGYQWETTTDLIRSDWGKAMLTNVIDSVEQAISQWQSALELALNPLGPEEYQALFQDELERAQQIRTALREGDWQKAGNCISDFSFTMLPRRKKRTFTNSANEQIYLELCESAKNYRDQAKAIITKLQQGPFAWDLNEQITHLTKMSTLVQDLVELVQSFSAEYAAAKRDRKIIDYADMEHLTIHLLTSLEISAEVLAEVRTQFEEILVDEYQDINPAQERIISLVSQEGNNVFRVGDVKQSIYRFRMADPSLFIDLYQNYHKWCPDFDGDLRKGKGTVINLNRNFRSRKEIIDGVNYLFYQIMTEETGEFRYDQDAALQYGASYLVQEQDFYTLHGPIELHLIDSDAISSNAVEDLNENDQDLSRVQLEARIMGKRILELMGQSMQDKLYVHDKKTGQYRPINYSDIVVLMRSYSRNAPVFIEEFQKLGIPVYGETNNGYFEATEVETMISLLKIIDNPHDDIPLAAVLRSPMVGLNGTELGRLRILFPGGNFYEAMALGIWASLASIGSLESEEGDFNAWKSLESEVLAVLSPYQKEWSNLCKRAQELLVDCPELKSKLVQFATHFYQWRSLAPFVKISDLIWQIYKDTGFDALVGCMPGGQQRQANLKILYDRACRFEGTHFRGLFRFLRFLEKYRNQNIDLGNARVLAENENVVRIMTVHASKGLEYPIVMLAGIGTRFNQQSLNSQLLMHSKLGIGIPVFDLENRVRYPSIIQYAIKCQLQKESLAEELRILYVALTRAKERLILFGSTGKLSDKLVQWHSLKHDSIALADSLLRSANSYLDWIGLALARHPSKPFQDYLGQILGDGNINAIDAGEPSKWQVFVHSKLPSIDDKQEEVIDNSSDLRTEPMTLQEQIKARLSWAYPYKVDHSYRAKTSVSELKSRFMLSRTPLPTIRTDVPIDHAVQHIRKPKFMEEGQETLSNLEKGIALHTACQHLPLSEWKQWFNWSSEEKLSKLEGFLETLAQQDFLTIDEVKAIDPRHILTLLDGKVGSQLLTAAKVMREIPFTLMKSVRNSEQPILVQGVIDVLIIDDRNNAVIVDYKTDFIPKTINPTDFFLNKYGIQLKLYLQAVEQLTNLKATACSIYSFALGKDVELIEALSNINLEVI